MVRAGRAAEAARRWRRWFEKTLEAAVVALLAALLAVVLVGVASRKAGQALVWYDEAASVLLAWLTYYGAALVALRRGHIGVPTLVENLRGRARTAAVLAGEAAVVAFFAALAWAGWQVQGALAGATLISLPGVPTALARSVIPIGALLFIAAQLLSLPEALRARNGGADP